MRWGEEDVDNEKNKCRADWIGLDYEPRKIEVKNFASLRCNFLQAEFELPFC
jgi:hypothetical protein